MRYTLILDKSGLVSKGGGLQILVTKKTARVYGYISEELKLKDLIK